MTSARSSGRIAAPAAHENSSATSAAHRNNDREAQSRILDIPALAAATPASSSTFGAPSTFTRFVNVPHIDIRNRRTGKAHDRIREIVPLIRADPRFDGGTTRGGDEQQCDNESSEHDCGFLQKNSVKPPVNSMLFSVSSLPSKSDLKT